MVLILYKGQNFGLIHLNIFVEDTIDVTRKLKPVLDRRENIVEQGENAGNQHKEKMLVISIFFFHNVFLFLLLQDHKNKALFCKGLTYSQAVFGHTKN